LAVLPKWKKEQQKKKKDEEVKHFWTIVKGRIYHNEELIFDINK
jgi:hypothetical protein